MNGRVFVLGTSAFTAEVMEIAVEAGFEVRGFIENLDPDKVGQSFEGRPVHWVEDIPDLAKANHFVCGLGTTHKSRFTSQAADLGARFSTIVHPTARIPGSTSVGVGTVIGPGVIVGSHARIGNHVLLNRGSMLGHHTSVGDHASIQPGANVAGLCAIGDATWIGLGAVVIDRTIIGAHSVIAAGAVVIEDVPANVLVAGVPARVKKEGIEGK